MFINLSNHPSEKWSAEMINEARKYGEIIDIPFPYVKADWDEEIVEKMAEKVCEQIVLFGKPVVMI